MEIVIYTALLELGPSTAGPVMDSTGLQNSVTHMAIHKLLDKGLATFIKKGKIRQYSASNPKVLMEYIEEKKRRLVELLPEMVKMQKPHERQEAEIFEGFKGFRTAYYELIKEKIGGAEYLFFSINPKSYKDANKLFEFFRFFERERHRRKIYGRGIAPRELKYSFRGRDMRRILFVDFPILYNITIYGDKFIMNSFEENNMVSIFIFSKNLASTFREYWHSIWDKYKK